MSKTILEQALDAETQQLIDVANNGLITVDDDNNFILYPEQKTYGDIDDPKKFINYLEDVFEKVQDIIVEELGVEKDYVITADTDSLFFELKDLIIKRKPDVDINNREEVVPIALEITKEYQDKTAPFLQNLCKDLFNVDNEYFELKQEVVLERGYFAGKRRYAQFIVNKEGVPTEELDIKGMDVMKSNMTPMYRKFGEEILLDIMYGKTKRDIDKKIIALKPILINYAVALSNIPNFKDAAIVLAAIYNLDNTDLEKLYTVNLKIRL